LRNKALIFFLVLEQREKKKEKYINGKNPNPTKREKTSYEEGLFFQFFLDLGLIVLSEVRNSIAVGRNSAGRS
jgi:hypothetical protein